jgi:hypothetical protein
MGCMYGICCDGYCCMGCVAGMNWEEEGGSCCEP